MKKIIAFMLLTVMSLTILVGCTPSEKEETTAPTTEGTKAPEINVAVEDIFNKAKDEIGENMSDLADADDEMLSTYYGINVEDLDDYVLKFPLMNVKADEILIAKVKEGKMEDVKAGIEKRQNDLEEQWKQYLPEQYEIVQKAQIIENGNYIMFVVGEQADKFVETFNEHTK